MEQYLRRTEEPLGINESKNIEIYKVNDLRMSEEMAMSVPFPEMMSWDIYFFLFFGIAR